MFELLFKLLKFIFRVVIPIVGVSILIIVPLLLLNINPYVRTRALLELKKQFPDAVVSIESAEFIRGQGIRLRGLRIRFPLTAFTNSETNPVKQADLVLPKSKSGLYDFVSVEEMYLVTPLTIKDVLTKRLPINRVQLRNADVVLYPIDNERWNFQYLRFNASNKNTAFREVELDDVDCQVRDYRKGDALFELRDIKAKMTLKAVNEYDIIGVMTGDYAKSITYSGSLNLDKKQVNIETNVNQCELSDRLYNALPLELLPRAEIARKLADAKLIKNVMGVMTSKCKFFYDGSAPAGNKLHYHIIGEIVNGRWDWNQASEPLTNIHVQYDLSDTVADIKSFTANLGSGKVSLAYYQKTYVENAPKVIKVHLDKMPIADRLISAFPPKAKEIWDSIQPSGQITADAHLAFDGKTWTPNIALQCHNCSLTYEKFPYPLSNLNGIIKLENRTLTASLNDGFGIALEALFDFPPEMFAFKTQPGSGLANVQDSINLQGSIIQDSAAKIRGSFKVKARNIPITDKVVNACHVKAQKLIRQFDPKGLVNVDVSLDVHGNGTPSDLVVDIALINCSGRYEPFPYPLRNLNGRLYMKNHDWTFENITAYTTPVRISGSGSVNLQQNKPHDFVLNLKLLDLPVDKQLSTSMPEESSKLIEELGLSGSVNAYVDIAMRLDVDNGPKLKIHAVPTGDDLSIRANSLPYRLDKVSGKIYYEDGRFIIKDFVGHHNQTLLCCQIDGMVIPRVGWKAKLSKVAVDRLRMDRDLTDTLPESVRKSITTLNLTGPLHYRGNIDLSYNYNQTTPLSAQWNGEIGVQEVSINKGILLRGICGGITTAGYIVNGEFYSEGQLAIESALWNVIQFSNIKGPYQINNNQVFFGTGAPEVMRRIFPNTPNTFRRPIRSGIDGKPQSLTAKLFGGEFYADIVLLLSDDPRFGIFAEVQNARLEQCGEVTQSERLLGKFHLAVNLWGASALSSLGGRGELRLEEADIYHLPAMVSMLKLLSIKEPSQNAFSNAEASFRIAGQHLFFDKMNFRGDAISLYGTGEMDFNKRVNLSFYTLVGKGDYYIPVIHDVFRGVSKNVMRIRMEGPINQLQIRRESPLMEELRSPPPQQTQHVPRF